MIYLFRIYQWLIAAPILCLLTIIVATLTIIGSFLGGSKWWGYYPPKLWAKAFCILMFVRVKVVGRENIDPKTSYVFVANHQGAYDIFTIYGYLNHNFKWMMKKELESIPFVGYACKKAGHIMVDKSSASALIHTMEIAKKRLQNGMSLVVFPEGARTWTGKMRKFKRGAFKLAVDFNLPIAPITIDGAFRVLPRTSKHKVTPGTITLTIHPPIAAPKDGHDMEKVITECYDIIHSALPDRDK